MHVIRYIVQMIYQTIRHIIARDRHRKNLEYITDLLLWGLLAIKKMEILYPQIYAEKKLYMLLQFYKCFSIKITHQLQLDD